MPSQTKQISQQAQQEISLLQVRLKAHQNRRVILERVFYEADRRRVTQQNLEERHIAEIWADLRGITVSRAVLDLAYRIRLLSQLDYEFLLKQIGETTAGARTPDSLEWSKTTGELWFQGRLVRKVRVEVATQICRILDGFQDEGWPRSIDNPIDTSLSSQPLHDAVASLNRGLSGVRFHVSDEGESIYWSPR